MSEEENGTLRLMAKIGKRDLRGFVNSRWEKSV